MIKITMTNSQVIKWQHDEFSDYMYDGKFFIIILDHVISIIIKEG